MKIKHKIKHDGYSKNMETMHNIATEYIHRGNHPQAIVALFSAIVGNAVTEYNDDRVKTRDRN